MALKEKLNGPTLKEQILFEKEHLLHPIEDISELDDVFRMGFAFASTLGVLCELGTALNMQNSQNGMNFINNCEVDATKVDKSKGRKFQLPIYLEDVTPEYVVKYLTSDIDARNLLAMRIHTDVTTTVWTTNSEDPLNALLGIKVECPLRYLMEIVFKNGKPDGFMISTMSPYNPENPLLSKSKIITAKMKDDDIENFSFQQEIHVVDPIFYAFKRFVAFSIPYERVRKNHAPDSSDMSSDQKDYMQLRLNELINQLGLDIEEQECTDLVESIGTTSTTHNVTKMLFDSANCANLYEELIHNVQEELVKEEVYSCRGAVKITEDNKIHLSTNTSPNVESLRKKWRKKLFQYVQSGEVEQLFEDIALTIEYCGGYLSNLIYLLQGNIVYDRLENN